jgi:glutamate dehydrogenase
MLDLTDNIVDGSVVPPPGVVRYDDDDPYLVVAADKGTASFSDIANGVSMDYGFWLGDAFASGGSDGYDHKQMGITARGAWESARRHMRELGVDIQSTDFTVCGIGDMSGDVFGNAMLLSEHIRLVAAFDHRDIFIDPEPDAATGFAERARLFALPRSSWADYDASLISAGGGVFSRASKSVALSDQVRAALQTEAQELTPQELIRAILSAPVDLLFNGGIGTYVKATTETHADVGDRGSEPLRIDATALRAKAVVEGGNLGLTQLARIQYALAGGRIYTDAIDNSAGVDCSDHEVNIKILLDAQVAVGSLTRAERNGLLHDMTDEVAQLVLQDNYSQTRVLAIARAQAASLVGVHARYIDALESSGRLNRRLERLPDEEQLEARQAAGVGLTAPEFAVLLAYTKLTLGHELLDSDVPEDPYLSRELAAYFPNQIQERFGAQLHNHPLAREIVAAAITNGVVNRAGITFVYRLEQETGAPASELVRAHRAAREIFAMREVWSGIERLDNVIAADVQIALHLETRRVTERAVRWLVRHLSPIDVDEAVRDFMPGVAQIAGILDTVFTGAERRAADERAADFERSGVPRPLARRVAALNTLFAGLDIVDVATRTKAPIDVVAGIYFTLGEQLELNWLRANITELSRTDKWQTLARAALRDDALAVHAELVADVLRVAPGQRADDAVAAWTKHRSGRLERMLRRLAEIRASGIADLATLSIAVREVRDLLAGQEQ